MITPQDAANLKDYIQKANTAYIVLGMSPTYDAVATALSLFLSLQQAGKQVQIASPVPMRVEFSYLVGVDQIKEKIGNKNLLVSFDYEENSVEKVSYTISDDGKKFNLIISPKAGQKPLDPTKLEYTLTGAEADIVFLVGVSQYEDLGYLYEAEQQFFENAFTVSINPYQIQPFAKINTDSSGQSSMAEGLTVLLANIELEPKDDIATNLLSSIEQGTNRFQSLGVTADTFEVVARLLRNGARRSSTNPSVLPQPHKPSESIDSFAKALKAASGQDQTSGAGQAVAQQVIQPQQIPQVDQIPHQQQIFQIQHAQKDGVIALETVLPAQQITHPTEQRLSPPPDWTQPKVFTGASKV